MSFSDIICNQIRPISLNNSSKCLNPLPLSFKWSPMAQVLFEKTLVSTQFKKRISSLETKVFSNHSDSAVNDLSTLIFDAAVTSIPVKRRSYSYKRNNINNQKM